MVDLLHSQFVGMHELRQKLSKLLDEIHEDQSELVITRQGKPAAVLLDVERYLEIQDALREFADPEYRGTLLEARSEIREGKGIPAEEVFRQRGL